MMAEFDASFPKPEDTRLRKNFPPVDQETNKLKSEQHKCNKCHQMPPVCICIDCGGISLCKACDKMMHKSSGKSKKRHRTRDLPSPQLDGAEENGFAEGKLIDFDLNEVDDIKCFSEAKPTSFLLVDGSEKLQVGNRPTFLQLLLKPNPA